MALGCINNVSECDGCMRCQEIEEITCPICGKDNVYFFYKDRLGEIVGCDQCLERVEP